MYIASPYGRVVALDPTTGKEVWVYTLPTGNPATRGVEYFSGDATTPPQIVVGTSDAKLFSLDAKTGALNTDVRRERHRRPRHAGDHARPAEQPRADLVAADHVQEPDHHRRATSRRATARGRPGDVRAFDIHDGKLAWTFHSIPRTGEPNFGHLARRQREVSARA